MSNNNINTAVDTVIEKVLSVMEISYNSKLTKPQFDTFAKNFSNQKGSLRAIITLKYMILGTSAWPRGGISVSTISTFVKNFMKNNSWGTVNSNKVPVVDITIDDAFMMMFGMWLDTIHDGYINTTFPKFLDRLRTSGILNNQSVVDNIKRNAKNENTLPPVLKHIIQHLRNKHSKNRYKVGPREGTGKLNVWINSCLLYTSPSPRD